MARNVIVLGLVEGKLEIHSTGQRQADLNIILDSSVFFERWRCVWINLRDVLCEQYNRYVAKGIFVYIECWHP